MLLVPSAKDLIPRFAEESTLGAHYGALATAGGIAVLAGIYCLAACWIARWCPQRRRCSLAAAGPLPALQRAGPEVDLPPAQALNRSLFRTVFLRQFRNRAAIVINQMADGQNGVTP
jgi:hypothetical protein